VEELKQVENSVGVAEELAHRQVDEIEPEGDLQQVGAAVANWEGTVGTEGTADWPETENHVNEQQQAGEWKMRVLLRCRLMSKLLDGSNTKWCSKTLSNARLRLWRRLLASVRRGN
jgi:hypothetical protein